MHLSQAPAQTQAPSRPGWAEVASQGLQIWQQYQLNQINKKRLEQGLPALTSQQTAALAPQARVQVGLSPNVRNMLIWGGLGLGAVLLMTMGGRRRRR